MRLEMFHILGNIPLKAKSHAWPPRGGAVTAFSLVDVLYFVRVGGATGWPALDVVG